MRFVCEMRGNRRVNHRHQEERMRDLHQPLNYAALANTLPRCHLHNERIPYFWKSDIKGDVNQYFLASISCFVTKYSLVKMLFLI
jgi:hypothetical protein